MSRDQHPNRRLGSIVIALIVGIASAADVVTPSATQAHTAHADWGRLLTTASERIAIERQRLRAQSAAARPSRGLPRAPASSQKEQGEEGEGNATTGQSRRYHIDGIVVRGNGGGAVDATPSAQAKEHSVVTVWLDGRAYQEADLPRGLKVRRSAQGEVLGLESASEFAKVAEFIHRP